MPRLPNDLPARLRKHGLDVEEVPGWQTRGHGDFTALEGGLAHHTATPSKVTGDYPSLRIVRDGHSDLPGPLAQIGLGRSGKVYVIASGVAWHSGTVDDAAYGNRRCVGVEAEADGYSSWPSDQYAAYVLLWAALTVEGIVTRPVRGHKEAGVPHGRKIDPNLDMGKMRADITAKVSELRGKSTPQKSTAKTLATPFPLAPGHWYGVDDRTPRSHSGARVADRAQVKRIQAKVGATADGRIGPRTAAAIAQWQRKNKLTADQKVGPVTWTKMGL